MLKLVRTPLGPGYFQELSAMSVIALQALPFEKFDAILLVVVLVSCCRVVVVRLASGNVIWSPWPTERHFTDYLGLRLEREPLSQRDLDWGWLFGFVSENQARGQSLARRV
jgi:hypothetical protein